MPSSLQNFRVGWSSTPTVTSPAAAPTGTCTSNPAGHNRTVAAADDDRPKAGGEVHLPTVLRENWRQLYRGRLKRRRAATPRLVPQPRRQPGGRSPSRDPEDEGGCQDRHRPGTHAVVARGAKVLAALRRIQRKTEREIPVVVLDPCAPASVRAGLWRG